MRLPPPGSDPAAIATYVDSLVRECANDPRRQAWEAEAERGVNLYLGNHYQTANVNGTARVVLNRIQNGVIALMAIQGGDPAHVTFTPRESGEPPVHFLNTKLPQGRAIADDIAAQSAGRWTPDQPLPDEDVDLIKGRIAAEQQAARQFDAMLAQAQAAGAPPAAVEQLQAGRPPEPTPDDVLVEVSDRTKADALQTIFDAMWDACDAQWTVAENILLKNVLGMQPTLYEFDDDAKRPILTNIHAKQAFFDPLRADLRRQQYAIYDEPISADEAVALYPHLEGPIRATFAQGSIRWPGTRTYDPGFAYQQSFERDMGVVRHAFIRSQPYPLTPEQAVAAGKLDARDVPAGPPRSLLGPGGECPGCGAPGMDALPLASCPDCGAPFGHQPTRPGHFLPGTDEEVTETVPDASEGAAPGAVKRHPRWPCRYGIRQLRVIAGACVDDRECEFADVPLPTNTNVVVPYSPYGQGEPARLEGLQMALNDVLTSIVTSHAYNAMPVELMPAKVAERLEKGLKTARSRPGQRVHVPEDLMQGVKSLKDLVAYLDPPEIPADAWKLLDFLAGIIDKEGNQTDVMSGNASASWSGDAIASLQNAASQVIKAKSMCTEHYLRRLAREVIHSIRTRMTAADWQRYLAGKPWQAVVALHGRDVEVDISIGIASGSGGTKSQHTQELIAGRNAKLPISDATLMERLDLDPKAEIAKQAELDRLRASLAPAAPAAAGAPAANNPANAPPAVVAG
jgi:hypothetical protein